MEAAVATAPCSLRRSEDVSVRSCRTPVKMTRCRRVRWTPTHQARPAVHDALGLKLKLASLVPRVRSFAFLCRPLPALRHQGLYRFAERQGRTGLPGGCSGSDAKRAGGRSPGFPVRSRGPFRAGGPPGGSSPPAGRLASGSPPNAIELHSLVDPFSARAQSLASRAGAVTGVSPTRSRVPARRLCA
jgi:hypothetical protein